jgi:hypothetical protein
MNPYEGTDARERGELGTRIYNVGGVSVGTQPLTKMGDEGDYPKGKRGCRSVHQLLRDGCGRPTYSNAAFHSHWRCSSVQVVPPMEKSVVTSRRSK